MLLFIRFDVCKNSHIRNALIHVFSSLFCCLLNNVRESWSIKSIQNSWSNTTNCRLSWRIIHQSQLTKSLSTNICFQVFFLPINYLRAFVLARWNNEQHVSFIPFFDDCLARFSGEFFKCLYHSVQIVALKSFEEKGGFKKFFKKLLCFWGFGEDSGDEIGLFIEDSETLCADGLSAVFLFIFFLEFLDFSGKLLIFFFTFRGGRAVIIWSLFWEL